MRGAPILAALLLSACYSSPKPGSGAPLVGWRPIQTFSGHGDSQTESFNIETGQWRIKWATSNENPPGSGTFRVTVHSAVSGRPLMEVVDHKGTGHGIALVTEDPRLYHLVIESKGVDWTVSVEESAVSYQGSSDEARTECRGARRHRLSPDWVTINARTERSRALRSLQGSCGRPFAACVAQVAP